MLEEQQIDFQKMPIFSGLGSKEIASFIEDAGGWVQQFSKGMRLPYEHGGDSRIGVFLDGMAYVLLTDPFGDEVLGYELRSGELFGNVWSVLGKDVCSNMSLEMRTQATVLWLPYPWLLRAIGQPGDAHGVVAQNLFKVLSRMMFIMMQKIEVLSQHTLRGRLRLYLIQQEKAQGNPRVCVPGRVQLAKILECNRSALTREIGHMEDEGVLVCGDDWMELKNQKKREE
ncbi:MAG: Crp/Fnr family transcriptional regulator [Schwartzia sp.]|nr:Crp/Fnr family transcriptional regulator [Schwartzia sp. (in: firmicutes)]